jgi:hypothetical protein
MATDPSRSMSDALVAGAAAAVLSGLPSTTWALATRRPLTEGALAAGSLLLPRERRVPVLMAAAVPVHLALSLGWAVAIERVLPPRRRVAWATLAGLGIAALDLGVIGRRFPRIRALPQPPQVADHLAYGATVGAVLELCARRRLLATPAPLTELP